MPPNGVRSSSKARRSRASASARPLRALASAWRRKRSPPCWKGTTTSCRRWHLLAEPEAARPRDPLHRGAGAECAAARRRARGFRRPRRDHQCAPRPGRHPVRTRARAGHQVLARHRPCRRHRPLDERDRRPASPSCRAATPSASSCRTSAAKPSTCASCWRPRISRRPSSSWRSPRQDHRRRARHRRPRQHAASARRRHHRLGQVGRHQHHDPVAALPADARAVPPDHDRPQDARTLGL